MSNPKPPENLTARARDWWSAVDADHDFSAAPETCQLLDMAATLMARAELFDAQVAREGTLLDTPRGPRLHPAIAASARSIAQFLATLRALGLAQTAKPQFRNPGGISDRREVRASRRRAPNALDKYRG